MDSTRLNVVADPDDEALAMLDTTMKGEGGNADLLCETPPRSNAKRVGEAILRSLGKQRKVQSSPKSVWRHSEIWLKAEGVRRLFFARASSLRPDALEALDQLRDRTGIDIWFLDPTNGEWSADPALEVSKWKPGGFEIRQREIREQREDWKRNEYEHESDVTPLGDAESLNEWPAEILSASPLGFLIACERASDSDIVLGEVKREFHTTLKMFQEAPYDDGLMGYNAGICRRTMGRLRFALSSATSEQRVYIRLKAAQVYAFRERHYLKHPDVGTCQRAAAFHPGLHRLKAFCEPNDAALALVSFGTGLCLNDIVKIRGRSQRYEFGGLPLEVPDSCKSIIRAVENNEGWRVGGDSKEPLLRSEGHSRSARSYFSLFKDLNRIEDSSKFRSFNRNWPAQWGFRMMPAQ